MTSVWTRFGPSQGLVAEWHRGLPDLVCPGFRLREPRLGDAERLAAAFGPEAASTLGIAAPGTSDEWMQFVARVRNGRAARHTVCYAVVPDASTDVGGLVLLQRLARRSRAATVSFVFSEAHWDTDLPAVSAGCMLEFAFQAVGVGRVEGRAGASRELEAVRRLGAVTEGVLRQSQPVGEGFADQTLWSVLATEWTQPDHSAPDVSIRVEQEHLSPGASTGGGDEEHPAWTVRLPTLEGSVVTLREIDLLDAPALLDALESADLEVAFEPAPSTLDEFRRYISWVQLQRTEGRAAGFAIVPRGARQAAGLLQIRRADLPGAVAEWGIVLASQPPRNGSGVRGGPADGGVCVRDARRASAGDARERNQSGLNRAPAQAGGRARGAPAAVVRTRQRGGGRRSLGHPEERLARRAQRLRRAEQRGAARPSPLSASRLRRGLDRKARHRGERRQARGGPAIPHRHQLLQAVDRLDHGTHRVVVDFPGVPHVRPDPRIAVAREEGPPFSDFAVDEFVEDEAVHHLVGVPVGIHPEHQAPVEHPDQGLRLLPELLLGVVGRSAVVRALDVDAAEFVVDAGRDGVIELLPDRSPS